MRKSVKVVGIGMGAFVATGVIAAGIAGGQSAAPVATTVSAPRATATATVTATATTTATRTATATTTATTTVTTGSPVSLPSGPAAQFDAGEYEVGKDIKPGKYKTAGPVADSYGSNMCYWSRNKDSSGNFNAIITNAIVQGPGVVSVNRGEVLKATGNCTWTFAG